MIGKAGSFVVRMFLSMILWVFLLSLPWNGRPIFLELNGIFVQNDIVAFIGDEIQHIWGKVSDSTTQEIDRFVSRERVNLGN